MDGARELAAAVEALYAAFAPQLRPHDGEHCGCCVDPAAATRLMQLSRRTASADDLARYATKAMTTWGNAALFAHFLPRLLELSLTREGCRAHGLQLSFIARSKLPLLFECDGDRDRVAPAARLQEEALLRFCRAAWDYARAEPPNAAPSTLDVIVGSSWLAAGIARARGEAGAGLSGLLDAWSADSGANARRRLAELVRWELPAILAPHGAGEWAGLPHREELAAWLSDPARRAELEAAFATQLGTSWADELTEAVDAWDYGCARPLRAR